MISKYTKQKIEAFERRAYQLYKTGLSTREIAESMKEWGVTRQRIHLAIQKMEKLMEEPVG